MIILLYLFFYFLFIFLILFLFYFSIQFFGGVPYLPTPNKNLSKMLELAELKPNELLIDLGSGDGRILIEAAKKGAKAIGYEIDPFLVWTARKEIKKQGLENKIKIYRQSFWKADLKEADVITFYGITGIMGRMEKKLLKGLKPGARVCSYVFSFPNWKPEKHGSGIFLYRKA